MAALICASTLVYYPWGWHPFGPVKWLLITVTAWLALAVAISEGLRLHRPSSWAWLTVLAWAAVTSAVAPEPLSAWLGTPDRRMGFVGIATMAAAYAAGQAVDTFSRRRVIARAGAAAVLGMGGYGLAEVAGWAIELDITTDRLGSTFGSPAYLGAALALLMPVCLGLALDPAETRTWRGTGGAAVVVGAGLLVGSASRAALAGLVAAALVAAPTWWRGARRRPLVGLVLVAAVVATVAVSPLGSRLAGGGDLTGGRVAEWSVGFRAFGKDPGTGAGLEGYRVVFPSVVDSDYVRAYGRSTVTDRAHSGPLDLAVTMGVGGLVAWLAAAGWLVSRAWRAGHQQEPILAGLAAGTAGLLAQELFLFPTLEVGVAGWAVAGAVVASAATDQAPVLRSRRLGAVAWVVAGASLVLGTLDVVADHLANGAREGRAGVARADQAGRLRPDSFRYPLLAADVAFRDGEFPTALDRAQRALDLAPLDPALRLARIRVLAASGAATSELVGEAVAADPTHPELRLIWGDVLAAEGAAGEAERAWLAAGELAPSDADPWIRLAHLYLESGEKEAAAAAAARARAIDPAHPALADLEDRLAEQ